MPSQASQPAEGHLARQLKWLTLFRVALVTVLLAATVVFNLQDDSTISERLYVYLYYLCMVVYVLSFGYTLAQRFLTAERQLQVLVYAQFTGDILLASALVLVTGGTDSAFTFFFSLVIIGGAIVLFRAGALYMASLSATVLLLIGLVEIQVLPYLEFLEEYRVSFLLDEAHGDPIAAIDRFYRMVYNVSVNALAFYGIAFLASWLSEQLRRSAEEIRTQAESLTALRALHRHIVGSVPSGLVTIDRNHRITSFNRYAQRVTKREAPDVLGLEITDVFRDLKFVLENPHKLKGVTREETALIVNRRRIYLGWSLSPLLNAQEELIGYTFMFQDITRVKDLEASSYRAEKLAAIGELAAAIAHEIRNPLAAMSGCIQLLQAHLDLKDTDKKLMDIVLRETEQLNNWINDFLDYSRPPPSHRGSVDLNALVNETISVFVQDAGLEGVTVEKADGDPIWVLGDSARMKQVVWNLLKNGTQSGGVVDVRLQGIDNGSRPLVELVVKDSGIGIEAGEVDRIFQPFYTTKERGTGLGLSVVHQIVTDHDGHITVDSTIDEGTTFKITLPMSLPPTPEMEAELASLEGL